MDDEYKDISGFPGFLAMIQIILIALKLLKIFNCSWVFILLPTIVTGVIFMIVAVIVLITIYIGGK